MSIDFEQEVSAALRSAADPLRPPPMDLAVIRRAGRRRRARSIAFAALAVVVAVGAGIGVIHLAAATRPGTRPAASPRPSGSGAPSPAPTGPVAVAAMTNVRAFYGRYEAASEQGRTAVDALIRARVASWYVPILEAPGLPGINPVECGHSSSPAGLYYRQAGEVAGRAVIVVGSRLGHIVNPGLSIVIADQITGKITGIACAITANTVTPLGARHAAYALYQTYIPARRQGTSVRGELARLPVSGPDSGSWYLLQSYHADVSRTLTYDPVICAPAGIPDVTVGQATTVADGSAGLVTITRGRATPILAVIVLSAKGATVDDIACPHP